MQLSTRIRRRVGRDTYDARRALGERLSDMSCCRPIPDELVAAFRAAREAAATSTAHGDRIFAWALHERDGRDITFHRIDDEAWQRWLAWYRYDHFRWNRPADPRLDDMDQKIGRLGRRAWANLFRRYALNYLSKHDTYSLPDVYYITKCLGRLPERVIDVGAGWGRLGMAWSALGVRTVGITDSIEQSYLIQHQYLASIPDVSFVETLTARNPSALDFRNESGVIHFPFWDLPKIPDASIDAVSCVQVLREVSKEFIGFLFSNLTRVLSPGGVFYIRDNDPSYQDHCMHKVDIDRRLKDLGFRLMPGPDLRQRVDIHGIPRLYLWNGERAG